MCGRRAAQGVAQVRMGFLAVYKDRKIDGDEIKKEKVAKSEWIVHSKGRKARLV
jgi:hypothetical protein